MTRILKIQITVMVCRLCADVTPASAQTLMQAAARLKVLAAASRTRPFRLVCLVRGGILPDLCPDSFTVAAGSRGTGGNGRL